MKKRNFKERIIAKLFRIKQLIVRYYYLAVVYFSLSSKTRACLVCGGTSWETLRKGDRYRLPITIQKCVTCGFVMQNPFPTREFIDTFYKRDYYRGLYWGSHRPPPGDLDRRKADSISRADFLEDQKVLSKETNVLDFGSGVGAFIHECKKRYPDSHIVGTDVVEGAPSNLPDGVTYDLITLFHVLEHLYSPVETLQTLGTLLNKDGVIFIEVPDVKDTQRTHDIHIGHVIYFNMLTLRNLVQRAGFKVLKEGSFDERKAQYVCITNPT